MKFATIRACLGWAFQMSQTVNVKTAMYSEHNGHAYGAESQADQIMTAINIMAKLGRLPESEQAVLAAFFTCHVEAVNEAALLLPMGWPTAMRRMFARSWARGESLEMTQAEIAAAYNFSQQTASRRWADACRVLNAELRKGMAAVELQLLDVITVPSSANAHRFHEEAVA